ncbi:MAG: FAD-dependent oxidoreductase, partial [Thermoanaerobacteraceae bacterium]|nr:FAD-dependent oxidoreductase [Thermoanaerobacteraceae bacterium]
KMNLIIVERGALGGRVLTADKIENYPGFPEPITGAELIARMEAQTRRLGAAFKTADVAEILEAREGFVLRTMQESISARAVILATGSGPTPLGVPGEEELRGRGVSYCAVCDGFFFRDEKVAVVGGGDAAVHEAVYLTRFVEKVTVIHNRDRLRAAKALQEQLFADPKVEVVLNTEVQEIIGTNTVEGIRVRNLQSGEEKVIPVSGVFVYVGVKPSSYLVRDLAELDQHGYVITDEKMATKTPGLFAAGDVRRKPLRQIVTAVADGAVAALSAEKYLRGQT